MTEPTRTLSNSTLFDALARTNLDRKSFIVLFWFYTIIITSMIYSYAQKPHAITGYPMHGPLFIAIIFLSERIYQRFKHLLITTTGFISVVLASCAGAITVLSSIILAQSLYPSVDIYLCVLIVSCAGMFVHHYVARMRNLKASPAFMLSPLAILPIPYVLYVLAFKDTLAD